MQPLILLTGLSGSGKTVALKQLEDLGYNCVDNLPVAFLEKLIQQYHDEQMNKIAVAMDVRNTDDLTLLPEIISRLRASGTSVQTVYLEANDQTLMQRYSESRRSHPLTNKLYQKYNKHPSLERCIAYEKNLLAPLRDTEHVIDTSNIKPSQLRNWIKQLSTIKQAELLLTFESFAFKVGVPSSADIVFDVRCLPNPHYDQDLRPLTGQDEPVVEWLEKSPLVNEMVQDIYSFINKWLSAYQHDTRSYLTVAIGCTGGQHRSVYVAEQLVKLFSHHKPLHIRHRAQTHL